jgi:hypothetical protein
MLQLCFVLVIAGISMVVSTMYIYVVPFLYATQHPTMFTLYVLYGHYLLVMICFNYFSGVYTNPGAAPKEHSYYYEIARIVYTHINQIEQNGISIAPFLLSVLMNTCTHTHTHTHVDT